MKKVTVAKLIIAILLSLGLVFVVSGCAKQPAESVAVCEEEAAVEEAAVVEEVELQEAESVVEETVVEEVVETPVTAFHVVKKGECLWWIAEYEDVYNDPFMWPILYKANQDQIANPDLIYPDQEFKIPRAGYTMDEIMESRQSAGAPRPYTPPEGALAPTE